MTIGRIPSVEGGIQPTIVDAKGDLIAATAADTVNRLAVGSNDQVLVADSSASTGLAWKSYAFQAENPVLNSGMDIWQRGTSVAITSTSTTAYQADRWQGYRGATGATVSRQATGDSTNLPNIQYAARVQRDSGNTSTSVIALSQSFESVNSIPFAGKTVTFSFYARAGANYSAASSALNVQLATGTGTDQNLRGGFTGAATPINTNATLTTTWQRFTYTANLSSTLTQLALDFQFTPVGTAGANDWFEITGVQLDVGSVATPYKRAMNTLQGELAACQRYYWKIPGANNIFFAGFNNSTTEAYSAIPLPVTMRVRPTTTVTSAASNLAVRVSGGTNVSCNGTTSVIGNTLQGLWFSTSVASGLTAGQGSALVNIGSAEAIEMSAEL